MPGRHPAWIFAAALAWSAMGAASARAQTPTARQSAVSPATTLVIDSVTIIDPAAPTESEARVGVRTVFVAGDRIERIAEAGAPIPPGVRRVDGRGRFLLPGFWDMHVHMNRDTPTQLRVMAPLLLAHGVTSVRDLSADCWEPCSPSNQTIDGMRDLQRRIELGQVLAPRLQALSSPIVHGPTARSGYPADFPEFWQPGTAKQARELVQFLSARGVDFIKPYHTMPRAAYLAMLEEARAVGLPVSGHLPWSVHPIEAVQAGVRAIEHARWPGLACNPEYEAFREMNARVAAQEGQWDPVIFARFRDTAVPGFDAAACAEIFRALVASDVYLVPTHLTREMDARAADSTYRSDPRRRYVPAHRLRSWDRDLGATAGSPPVLLKFYREFFDLGLRVTGLAQAAGVKILVGTDAFDTMVFPGLSYHDELALLHRAGLNPLEILRAATIRGPEFLGKSDRFGSIAAGKVADLVLLDADPLQDIRHTTRIRAVVFDGLAYDRAALDAMIRGVEEYVAGME